MSTAPLQLESLPDGGPFSEFGDDFRRTLVMKGLPRDFLQGEVILAPGGPGRFVYFLVSGKAAIILQETEGESIVVDELEPGEIIGEIRLLTGQPSQLNSYVMAEEDSTVLELPSEDFEAELKRDPKSAMSVLKSTARKVVKLNSKVYKNVRKKRALQALISRQDHLFPDYFVSETVRRRVGKRLQALAQSDAAILITGETGVGKEFMAHAVYEMSPHHKRVFLCLDLLRPFLQPEPGALFCELPEPEQETTEEQTKWFFGLEAVKEDGGLFETPGYLELCEEGTLLVRGIEQLTPAMQIKLLRTLQTGKFRRVGSHTEQTADFRLIGSTNLDEAEITLEKHPLLYWLLDNSLIVPPLRKRRKEIPDLVRYYVNKYCQELHKEIRDLPKETIQALVTYNWPGNDRELATTLKRAVLLAEEGALKPQDIYFDLRSIEGSGKLNLMRVPGVHSALSSPLFPAIFQSAAAPFFFILLILLFLGPVDPKTNIGSLFSWAVGWPTMVFGSFIWARFWCSICPMGSLSNLAKKLISYELPLPSFFKQKSDWIVAGTALLIIWVETATDMRNSPFNTGLLLLTILLFAFVISIIFEKQSWCRYLCPLGGMMGLFSKCSPFELRADRRICASQCTTNDCYTGTKTREGCPFGQLAPTLRSNRFCKMCGTCVKNCPHGAVRLNLRVPGREIWEMKQVGAITAMLVLSMYGGLMSEMLHRMPIYTALIGYWPQGPELLRFTFFFLGVIATANLCMFLAASASSITSGETVKENFARYGLALLPLVLAGYMAFHFYYLINLGVYFPILLWETFKFELFKQMVITVPPSLLLFLQKFIVFLGVIGSTVLAFRLAKGRTPVIRDVLKEFAPHAIVVFLFYFALIHALEECFR